MGIVCVHTQVYYKDQSKTGKPGPNGRQTAVTSSHRLLLEFFIFFVCLFFFPAILKIEFPNQGVSAAAGPNVKSANSLLKHPGRRQPSALSNPWGDS